MAIGVGAGLGREANVVYADASYSLTPNQSSTGSSATTYITTLTEFTYNGISWKMNQWNPSTLQIKTNQSSASSEFRFYNTSAFAGKITQVVISFQSLTVANENGFMFVGGTSAVTGTTGGTSGTWNENAKTLTWTPSNSDNFTYFAFYQNGKVATATNKLATSDAIVVTYDDSGTPVPTTYTVTYDANGATGDVPTDSTKYESGEPVTVLGSGNLSKDGYTFGGWALSQDDQIYQPNSSFNITGNVTLTAVWNVIVEEGLDVLDRESTGIANNGGYGTWTGIQGNSGAVYAGNSGGTNNSIQLRSNNNNSGVVTTASGGILKKVTVVWESHTVDGRTLNVYGNNAAYTSPEDLFDTDKQGTLLGTIVKGTSTELVINSTYHFVGVRSNADAMYLSQLKIKWEQPSTEASVSLTTEALTMWTNEDEGHVVSAYVENVDEPTYSWTVNNSNVTLEDANTKDVRIKPNTNVDNATSVVTLVVGGTTPNLTKTVTVTLKVAQPGETPKSAYTVSQARSAIDANTNVTGVYATGKVSSVDSYNSNYHTLTYSISEDGKTTGDQLKVYSGKNLHNTNFSSTDDIEVGATVIVLGNLSLYNSSTYQFNQNNYLISYVAPVRVLDSISVDGQKTEFELNEAFVFDGTVTAHYDDGTERVVNTGISHSNPDMTTDGNKIVTISYTEGTVTKETTYQITVKPAPVPAIEESGLFVKVESISDIVNGERYLIVYQGDDSIVFDGSKESLDVASNGLPVSSDNLEKQAAAWFVIDAVDPLAPSGSRFIKSASGMYIGSTSNNNKIDANENTVFENSISIDEDGYVVITGSSGAILRYNKTSGQERFRYFKSDSYQNQQPILLYRFRTASATPIATIRGTEAVENGNTVVTSLNLRFGIKIPKADWNAIQDIEDYGVMMFLTTEAKLDLGTVPSVQERYEESTSNVSVGHRNSNAAPAEDGQGNYNFTVMINVPDASWYDYYFCVRPFIKINDQVIWLLQEDLQQSVRTLADNNNGTNFSPEALTYLRTATAN